MQNVSRKHHFVPVFYLKGFTATDKQDARLHVFDKKDNRTRPSRPTQVANENHLYAVSGEDVDTNAVEKIFAEFGR